jgi:hypothetical protein
MQSSSKSGPRPAPSAVPHARRDWLLLVATVGLLARIRLSLSLTSLQHVRQRIAADRRAAPTRRHGVTMLAWAVRNGARLVPGASCLVQALTLQELLNREGVASIIKLGVREAKPQTLAAHAWVLVEGRVVLGGTEQSLARFSPIAELGPLR